MKYYELLISNVGFGIGKKLYLSKELAEKHDKKLIQIADNIYRVVKPIRFKKGDVVGFAGACDLAVFAEVAA